MIPLDSRFTSYRESFSGTVHINHIIDLDQRHWIEVQFPDTALRDDDDPDCPQLIAYDILRNNVKDLVSQVHKITADRERKIIAISRDPEDDPTVIPEYPKLNPNAYSVRDDELLQMSELTEVDRLSARVDLVKHSGHKEYILAVFKYSLIREDLEAGWNEAHLLRAVCSHEFIVPFDKFIVEGVDTRFVGHTTKFVLGGTLENNKTRPFQFIWLKQLTSVVDYLNLELGIDTQDIRPCNLLIDPINNRLQLFDFEKAGRIGNAVDGPWNYRSVRNDVDSIIFTIYEILTHDYHFRDTTVSDWDWDVSRVENLSDWDIKRAIEGAPGGAQDIRNFALDWAQRRRSQPVKNWAQALRPLQIPEYPFGTAELLDANRYRRPPLINMRRRRQLIREGQHVLNWERPGSNYDTEILRDGFKAVQDGLDKSLVSEWTKIPLKQNRSGQREVYISCFNAFRGNFITAYLSKILVAIRSAWSNMTRKIKDE